MLKKIKNILSFLLILIILTIVSFFVFYFSRIQTINTIKQITDYDDNYNLYQMEIKYDYSIDDIIDEGIDDYQSFVDAVINESLPFLPVSIKVPTFGCSAFTLIDSNNDVHMGRNYDFRNNSSAMLVYCSPKDGYKSVGFAALDNVSANIPDQNIKKKLTCLTAPFICLDGMNEKGVSIAVLTLDSEPTIQSSGKQTIATTLAIRLVLDRAATTEEAVELLNSYDMLATAGKDYHFYITDSKGDGRVVEYDPESEERTLVATPLSAITNFYAMYKDKVLPNQKNGIYGHGKERYDAILEVFENEKENYTNDTVINALIVASQAPSENDITSNTQWSINYNNTDLTAEIVIRRNWDDINYYSLKTNTIE